VRFATRLTIIGAIVAPSLHAVTDVMEWAQRGFSPLQLWLNYAAFLPVPAIMLGLYAAQRPRIAGYGLLGALGYGFAFIYFSHTTLRALETATPDYQQLWSALGPIYTAHGALMIAAGLAFGVATLRAGVFPSWTSWVFLSGISFNLVLGLLPGPDIWQIFGTFLRNIGLVGMGWALAHLNTALPPAVVLSQTEESKEKFK
jgi:hypothetical protein